MSTLAVCMSLATHQLTNEPQLPAGRPQTTEERERAREREEGGPGDQKRDNISGAIPHQIGCGEAHACRGRGRSIPGA